jgi:hypothetical protein
MGEASRRGTFEQRKEKSIARKKEKIEVILNELENDDKELSQEEVIEQDKKRHAIMALINFAKRNGWSAKELKRRMKRQNKKHI